VRGLRLLSREQDNGDRPPAARAGGRSSRRVAGSIALPRVPTFAATRPLASPNLALVDSWPALTTSRQAALSIPAIKNARDLIIGAAVQIAPQRYRGAELVNAGRLLEQPDPDCTWQATLAGTLEDLIFDGTAYWLVLARDGIATERNPDGLPVRARWIPVGDVELELERDTGSYARLNGYKIAGIRGVVDPENVIRFDSPLAAVLRAGAESIEASRNLEDAAARHSNATIPTGTLTNEGAEVSEDEAEEIVARFEAQREAHGVAFLQGLSYERQMLSAEDLELVQARANAATDAARLTNMPVAMIAASPSGGASAMLYSNLGAQLTLMVSSAVAPYLVAVAATLSLDTVTPRGQRVSFDTATFLRSDPAEHREHVIGLYEAGARAQGGERPGLIDREEARAMLGLTAGNAGITVAATPERTV
jgi:hypothetical protein